jgi:hypothetical protein
MKVNPQTFFSFCAAHVALLRELTRYDTELSDSEISRLIRSHSSAHEELPETTWRRLRELQILIPTEPGSASYLLAEPVRRLLSYLLDESNPATPEMIRGYITSLETMSRQLVRAIDRDDITGVALAFTEVNITLRRIHADLEETQRGIQSEIAAFKTAQQPISVRDKFRRIVHWMERYVGPMIEIVRADGPLRGAFDEIERLLRLAREQALFNDHPALERNLRFLRLLRSHALRVFDQCRKEIEPLYQSLRRGSFIAEGAALALDRLQTEGISNWGNDPVIAIFTLRWQTVPGDQAIGLALRRVIEHPPEAAPALPLQIEGDTPPALLRRLWIDSLPGAVQAALPLEDLLAWLIDRYPNSSTAELLSGFTSLAFAGEMNATFTRETVREYVIIDGTLHGHPLRLEST